MSDSSANIDEILSAFADSGANIDAIKSAFAVLINSNLSPEEVRLRAQLASYESWAKTEDRSARTAPARKAFDARFYEGLDDLPPEDREKRATARRKAYFTRLNLKRATAARKRREAEAG